METEELANDHLVTFGIVPSFPHTGYGYIKTGDPRGSGNKVAEFREKPGPDEAERFVGKDTCGTAGYSYSILNNFNLNRQNIPPLFTEVFGSDRKNYEIYNEIPAISVDYGVMEKSDRVAVCG